MQIVLQHSLGRRGRAGFTLMELLVVITIIGVLSSLLLPTLNNANSKARMVNELNSARQMMLAWQMYADDHDDRILPGYRYGIPAFDRQNQPLEHPINARYPWRLAPYLGNNFEVLYVNRNRRLLHQLGTGDNDRYTYSASVFPSLAANSIFVGGDDLALPPTIKAFAKFGPFCLLKDSAVRNPSRIAAFVSARSRFNGSAVDGFYRAEGPYLTRRVWEQEYSEQAAPEAFGFVHPRYNLRTVAAIIDGHAEVLGWRELQDMRRWCDLADRADWVLSESARQENE